MTQTRTLIQRHNDSQFHTTALEGHEVNLVIKALAGSCTDQLLVMQLTGGKELQLWKRDQIRGSFSCKHEILQRHNRL